MSYINPASLYLNPAILNSPPIPPKNVPKAETPNRTYNESTSVSLRSPPH